MESPSTSVPAPATGSITHFVNGLRGGSPAAAEELWRRFCPRLLGLACKALAATGGNRQDADDAVQSALGSFWRKLIQGDFSGEMRRERLWQLLATITVRKVWRQKERAETQKRGGGRVVTEGSLARSPENGEGIDQLFGRVSPPEMDLCCEELLLQLDAEPRAIAVLRLMGYTNREIAGLLDCSERKVERKLQIVRMTWDAELTADSASGTRNGQPEDPTSHPG